MYELFIALRHLTSRRRQTIFSVLAVGLAVMLLVWSQAMMVGFTDEMYSKTVDRMAHVTVEPQEDEDYIHLYRKLTGDIRGIDGVVGVSPVLAGPATFEYKDKNKNVVIQGIQVDAHDSVLHINTSMTTSWRAVSGTWRFRPTAWWWATPWQRNWMWKLVIPLMRLFLKQTRQP